jgi:hypothetical protein
MNLDARPPFPHQLCYVLKLHRDVNLREGQLRGVLEHVSSGHVIPFDSTGELQAALVDHATHELFPAQDLGSSTGE